MINELAGLFVSIQLKAMLIAVLGLSMVALARRIPSWRQATREQNLILKMTMSALLAMPALVWLLPEWRTPGSMFEITVLPSGWSASAVNNFSTPQWKLFALMLIYLLIASVAIVWLTWRYAKVSQEISTFPVDNSQETAKLIRNIQAQLKVSDRIELRIAPNNISPFLWGLHKTTLVVPASFSEWSAELKKDVLLHELLHAKHGDHTVILLSHCCRAIYWINPLAWYLHRRLHALMEETCDARVIDVGIEPRRYADHLLFVAKEVNGKTGSALCSMAGSNNLSKRLTAIIHYTKRRTEMTRVKLAISAAICIAVVGPIAALKSVPAADAAGLSSDPYVALHKEVPHYPETAMLEKIEGYVVVEFDINIQGQTENLMIIDAQPVGVFEDSALEAVKLFLYQPATANGIPQVSRGIRNKLTYKLSAN